jgi:predicted metalloprotease with PDZ domain
VGAGALRLVVQQVADGIEVCPRLGLLLAPEPRRLSSPFDGRTILAVLAGSPCDCAGLVAGDVVVTINNVRLDSVRHLTFSDRRRSKLDLLVFIASRAVLDDVKVSVPPEPYRSIEDIVAEAMLFAAALSAPRRRRL